MMLKVITKGGNTGNAAHNFVSEELMNLVIYKQLVLHVCQKVEEEHSKCRAFS